MFHSFVCCVLVRRRQAARVPRPHFEACNLILLFFLLFLLTFWFTFGLESGCCNLLALNNVGIVAATLSFAWLHILCTYPVKCSAQGSLSMGSVSGCINKKKLLNISSYILHYFFLYLTCKFFIQFPCKRYLTVVQCKLLCFDCVSFMKLNLLMAVSTAHCVLQLPPGPADHSAQFYWLK